MPYSTITELPPAVRKKYTSKQQRAFREAFNSAQKNGRDESTAFRIAHRAAQRAGDRDAPQNAKGGKTKMRTKSAEVLAGEAVERARTFTAEQRKKLASSGKAMSDGSFPIENEGDLRNAIQAVGRASNTSAARAHIKKRARALGLTKLLPEGWRESSASTGVQSDISRARAFVTEANGRTILTAPASIPLPDELERAWTPNPHFIYLQGAFVGAEEANRNNAMWTTGDLEMGEPTVKHGPLNWLHEERRIIGAIAEAKLVSPTQEQAAQRNPFIAAASVVWKWLWPHESQVVEQAADVGRLWYSMECVSREIACVDHECGSFPYMDVQRQTAGVCDHVKLKQGRRRFVDPIFLGGAAIVPPVRPGWPEAHASLMRQASSHAEQAFEQAGAPDVPAAEWEALMGEVLRFAGADGG